MTPLTPTDFAEFFRAVYDGREPFPWQLRVAARACGDSERPGEWPRCIALPTAAGKTACIDIAVFALAYQAALPPERRTAPRRIFFVVDRRVVVDQAYDHARKLAEALRKPKAEILKRVAGALTQAGADSTRPLDYYALRGGMYRESAWVRSPLQPTVVVSTVDQVGSRLLFRGYGVSDASKPLHAALVGNDALILLDEAHCARPFDQTMTLVRKYRQWTADGHTLPLPLHFVTMPATPTGEVPEDEIERLGNRDRQDPELGRRIASAKPARLIVAERAKGARWRDGLVKELVEQAKRLHSDGRPFVGIIVNRVATARDTADALREEVADRADVILLTGRMRPVDRTAIMTKLDPLLSKNSRADARGKKPTFVVATQTLEVGADLDFHALVTECASLDALRQRFGRLNRVAARDNADAVIVVRADQAASSDDDPVYGASLASTWQWLHEHAVEGPIDTTTAAEPEGEGRKARGKGTRAKMGSDAARAAARIIDCGVAALEALLTSPNSQPDDLAALNSPSVDAAVLLPAHLDTWCQTSPRPAPDPDPSDFLHGPQRGEPQVQVVFRADLGDDTEKWVEILSICPPSSSEALPVRLSEFRRWLMDEGVDERSSDVEGQHAEEVLGEARENAGPVIRRALRWRGPESPLSVVIDVPGAVTPNDTYVVSISSHDLKRAAALLGDFPTGPDGQARLTDAGDEAFQTSRDKAILRLRHNLYPSLGPSIDAIDPESMVDDKADEALAALKKQLETNPDEAICLAVEALGARRHRTIARHPLGGIVLIGKRRLHRFDPTFVEPGESWESCSDRPYPLDQHCRDVARLAESHAEQSGLGDHSSSLELAGWLHDAGKADPRFQGWLHGGNLRRAEMCGKQYSKSIVPVRSRREFIEFRGRAGYPTGARHEFVSVRLAECDGVLPAQCDAAQRDLVLHLIGAHHGYCRPFAPVIDDPQPVQVVLQHNGHTMRTTSATALERLDSGVAERFWTLTRRYGWWGLPYLEALLRLADWACSEPVGSAAPVGTENRSSSTPAARSRLFPSETAP